MLNKSLIATIAVLSFLVLAGGSQASIIYGTVWENATAQSMNPSMGPPATPATSSFSVDVTDQISFDSRIGGVYAYQATYDEFLNNPNWIGTDIGGDKIDTYGGHGTFFKFTGSMFLENGKSFDVLHDDGFWLQIGAYTFDYSAPVSPTLATITWTHDSGIYSFVLNYGAYNSYPEVLITRGANFSVPEPGTMLLLGFGLIGLAGVRRFKK
jgi:hypothetical protein